MRVLLSRYLPRYPATLVYMLQASEYHRSDYLAWLLRTGDFRQVSRRKRLELTAKARLLLVFAWLVEIGGFVGGVVAMIDGRLLTGLAIIILTPWLLPYVLLVPAWVGSATWQRWQERRLNSQTAAKLHAVNAVKIAIAGSYGKTTMKELLATVLGESFSVAVTPANFNTPAGIARFAQGLSGEEQVLVFELGEYYPGDISQLSHIVDPDIGIITGVNAAHLSRFKTLERTTATIFELADYLGDKPVYVNAESQLAAGAARQAHERFSVAGAGGWTVESASIATGLEGLRFAAKRGKQSIQASSGLIGRHLIGPLTAVIAIASELEMSPDAIEKGIANTAPFEHRLQPRRQRDGSWIIDDTYNGNPDGARVAIEFLRELRGHRRIYVTPGLVEMGPETEAVHREIGKLLADAVEMVVLVDNSVAPFIKSGLEQRNFKGETKTYPDSLAAIHAVPALTKAGDVVLLQNDWGDSYA